MDTGMEKTETGPEDIIGENVGETQPRCCEEDEGAVSMRCLRHKKRFNVPKWWLKVSNFLCPKCYERLGEEDRIRYSPKEGIDLSHRDAEEGKDLIVPQRAKEEYIEPPPPPPPEIDEESKVEEQPKKRHKKSSEPKVIFKDYSFEVLLPRYKITCQNCGETVPCHYDWFDKSTVLCPECYEKMHECEIQWFHAEHKAPKPPVDNHAPPLPPRLKPIADITEGMSIVRRMARTEGAWTRSAAEVNNGGCWSTARIMNASKRELIHAAKCGRVTKARVRIELERRRNSEYYDMLPQEVGTAPIMF